MHNSRIKARLAQAGDRLGEPLALQLMVPSIGFVGSREMRERAVALQPGMKVDAASEIDGLRIVHANSIHARVDGHVVLAHLAKARRPLTICPCELR